MRAPERTRATLVLSAISCLSILLSCATVVSAAADDSSSGSEVTPPPLLPGGGADPLFDDDVALELDAHPTGFPDPWEETNRGVFGFNNFMDRYLLDPVTAAYGFLFPRPLKVAIRRVFENADEPSTVINDILQLEWSDAATAGARFVVNSSLGVAGIFDLASYWGLERHRSDFGQTLTLAGAPSGPYVVLPFAGPNNVRDGAGALVDSLIRPSSYLTYLMGPVPWLFYQGGSGLSTREAHLTELQTLRDGSVDHYAALRNAYYQNRLSQIWDRREHRRSESFAKAIVRE